MGLIDLITGRTVNQFGKDLVQELIKRYPPEMQRGESRKISAKGVANILESIIGRAVEFKSQRRLGLLGKARLGNTFKWELKEAGYGNEFIEMATEALIVYMTRKATDVKPDNPIQ